MLARKAERTRISIRKEYIEQNRLRLGFERKLRLQMQTLFAETGQQAQQDYSKAGRLINTQRDFSTNLKAILDAQYRAVIDEFGLRILRYQKQDSQFEVIIREFIKMYGATRVTQISGTTLAQIQRIISAGELEGLGVSTIATNIFESMRGSFSRIRSATIARTETHSAASYANHAVNASLKIPNQKKRWVSVSDLRAREWHTAMNGVEVELDEDFIVPHNGIEYRMEYTGDPRGGAANVINCRCVTLYVTPEDEIED
tara:strand:+ start:129 stop:902 length:774 start_codon:yes stop_codon:yes gene_type:complete